MSSALAPMTREEIAGALQRQFGLGRAKALRMADLQVSGALGEQARVITLVPQWQRNQEKTPDPAPITWPLQLTLPWSCLESDDAKYGAVVVNTGKGKLIPKLILQARYRDAKAKIRRLARDVTRGAEPASVPLQLVARVWVPDRRRRDVPNFAKCTHDALQEAVYTDDTWLYDTRWIRAGVDVDHPRAEITITPVQP